MTQPTRDPEFERILGVAMATVRHEIKAYLEDHFPIEGQRRAKEDMAQIMAAILLTLAGTYAKEAGLDPVEWLAAQAELNLQAAEIAAKIANAQNN